MVELKSCRVLVTPGSYGQYDPRLKEELRLTVGEVVYNTANPSLTSIEVAELLPGCHGYIAGLDVIDSSALQAADNLRVISRYGVGVDNVDLVTAHQKSIIVTNTPGVNSASVAELTVGFILSLARQLPHTVAATRAGEWNRLNGLTLEGKTIGLVGFGAVGQQVARRLANFGCCLLAYDPIPVSDVADRYGVTLLPLEDVLSKSDFLSLHLPLLTETREMVNRDFIARMKPGAYLINTSRGEIVDEPDLIDAIQRSYLSGAALDVFAKEPPGAENPLLKLRQVIATPHCASHTDGALNAMGWMALNNCLAVLRGEEPANRVI
jgi:phosphoglycerate dehydrogenase-like enzyme